MKTRHLLLTIALATASSACMTARVHPEARFKGSWAENPEMDRQIRSFLEENNEELTAKRADPSIEVWVGKIPAGIELQGGVISVKEGVPYEIVGKATLVLNSGSQFGFPDYEQGWRKGLCYWQAPLTWLTLGIWAVVPVNYPCGVEFQREKEDVLNATRNLVEKVGGHFFVGDYLYENDDLAAGVQGFVVRKLEEADQAAEQQPVGDRTTL